MHDLTCVWAFCLISTSSNNDTQTHLPIIKERASELEQKYAEQSKRQNDRRQCIEELLVITRVQQLDIRLTLRICEDITLD